MNWKGLLVILFGLFFSCKELEDFEVDHNKSISGELYQDMSSIGLYENAPFGGYFTYADIFLLYREYIKSEEYITANLYIDGSFIGGVGTNNHYLPWLSGMIGVSGYSGTHDVVLAVYIGSFNEPQDKSNGLATLLAIQPGTILFRQRLHFDQSSLDEIIITRQEIIGSTGYVEWIPPTAENFAYYRIYPQDYVHEQQVFDQSEYILDRNQTSIEVDLSPGKPLHYILEYSNRLEMRQQYIFF